VLPANPSDAHRPLGREHDLAAVLSQVQSRQVQHDYTFRFEGQWYQIARPEVRPGLRGAQVRVEARLDGSLAVRFRERYLAVSPCQPPPKVARTRPRPLAPKPPQPSPRPTPGWCQGFDLRKSLPVWRAANLGPDTTPALE
jgi:hypothetical protein